VESVLESPIFAGFLLAGAVGLWALALTAGGAAWVDYSHLFDESKLVHVTTVDFFLLSAFAPFWMYNDAQLRDWKPRCAVVSGCRSSHSPITEKNSGTHLQHVLYARRDKLVPLLSFFFVVGPGGISSLHCLHELLMSHKQGLTLIVLECAALYLLLRPKAK